MLDPFPFESEEERAADEARRLSAIPPAPRTMSSADVLAAFGAALLSAVGVLALLISTTPCMSSGGATRSAHMENQERQRLMEEALHVELRAEKLHTGEFHDNDAQFAAHVGGSES
jgi:hypothetical protein